MTLPDYDAGWDSNRRPKPDGLVEWLEDAIKGEPEAEAVIAAVQEARRKAKAFDWMTKRFAEGVQTYDFPDLIFYDDPLESLKSVEAEMERSQ